MNKLTTAIVAIFLATLALSLNSAKAEFRVGAMINAAGYYGNAQETLKDSGRKSDAEGIVAMSYGSVFAEYSMGDDYYGLTFGLEYTTEAMDLDKETRTDNNVKVNPPPGHVQGGNGDTGDQIVDAKFSDLYIAYVQLPVGDSGGYVKAGISSVEVESQETLATGTGYGDETLSGVMLGIGYQGDYDQFFYRLEAVMHDFDDFKLTGTEEGGTSGSYNTIEGEVGGVAGRLAVGYSF